MNLDAFVRQRTPEWEELAQLVASAGHHPEKLGPGGVRRLGTTYRAAAADLALARRRWPGDPVTVRLEDLVGRSRHLVYASESRSASLRQFLSLVAPHGVLELSVIAVSGAAGFSVGWALIDPGRRSRRVALGLGARRGAEIVLGTMPWFVLAGVVEGFVTPTALPLAGAITVGLLVAAPYWALVFWRGRPEPAEGAV